ncbi:GntR family transcriptional regulator [Corticibacter populi]|uniref:GntR family transcriptional regulator n=1 Tax=Corticibacter populi TaxID=1550736 RepID=A0A3M6QS96_9BURK|nr:GntR family transcriptional regulator [Corticibacter populi]RMX05898.1 GntR family transcriptional regulator [Corticibacter populi]RZS30783.1 DNA-binding GntR family transcriptional regulator [Corticibacter populi]
MDSSIKPRRLGDMHSPLTELVTQALREKILNGEFKPGDRLVEGHLSELLGVSRMPIREVLRTLAAEGIVTIEPRRGASVTKYTPEQIEEMVEVRATLEALNAKLAARRHDPDQIAKLQRLLDAGSKLGKDADTMAILRDNAEFHEAITRVAANSVLGEIIRSLRARTALIFANSSQFRIRENWEEHAAILRAVISGDAELAALLAARHVYNAARSAEALPALPGEAPLQPAEAGASLPVESLAKG